MSNHINPKPLNHIFIIYLTNNKQCNIVDMGPYMTHQQQRLWGWLSAAVLYKDCLSGAQRQTIGQNKISHMILK